MDRARRAGWTVLIIVAMVVMLEGGGGGRAIAVVPAWPPSTLVVSEVQTGGASASDEFVELANQGATPIDLQGLEVVYATSTGSTVTRKATWTVATILDPGRRILIANAAGALRRARRCHVLGWFRGHRRGRRAARRWWRGDRCRRLGRRDERVRRGPRSPGASGRIQPRASPGRIGGEWHRFERQPCRLVRPGDAVAAGPRFSAGAGTGADTEPDGNACTDADLLAEPVGDADTDRDADPDARPRCRLPRPRPRRARPRCRRPRRTRRPRRPRRPRRYPPRHRHRPRRPPRHRARSRSRSPRPGRCPTAQRSRSRASSRPRSARSSPATAASSRMRRAGSRSISTAPLQGAGRPEARSRSRARCRVGIRSERCESPRWISGKAPPADLPAATGLATGAAGEAAEGRRVFAIGTVVGSPDQLTDGLAVTIDDGSGPLRAVIGPDALGGQTIASGMVATVTGPLGQRDSSGTGTGGYRIQATLDGELGLATPTPTPTPTPSASVLPTPTAPTATPTPTSVPAPTATSTPRPTATPTPTPIPTPAADVTPLNAVRTLPLGTRVRTTGVIVAEPGRLGTPALIAIGDASAGLVVRGVSGPGTLARGTRLEVAGKLAAPYGQLEIRPTEADVHVLGTGALPTPKSLSAAALVEADEGHLVTATGRLDAKPTKSSRRGRQPDAHPRRGCAGQGHGRRHEPAHPRGVQGRRDIPDRRVRRPAGHPDRGARRLPDLDPRRRGPHARRLPVGIGRVRRSECYRERRVDPDG